MKESPSASQSSIPQKREGRWSTPGRGNKVFTIEDQIKFIKKYLRFKSVERAAAAVGFRENTIYKQAVKSKRFAAMFEEAKKVLVQQLGPKMIAFAHGVEMPTHNAQLTSMFGVLKAFEPEKWRENVNVKVGAEGALAALLNGMAAALPNPDAIPVEKTLPAPSKILEHQP